MLKNNHKLINNVNEYNTQFTLIESKRKMASSETVALLKVGADAAAISATVATILQWLPPTAAFFSIIWLSLQIYSWFVNKNWKAK